MILKKKTPRQHDLPENISNFTMRDYVISMFNGYITKTQQAPDIICEHLSTK
jgi:hypothetical protein